MFSPAADPEVKNIQDQARRIAMLMPDEKDPIDVGPIKVSQNADAMCQRLLTQADKIVDAKQKADAKAAIQDAFNAYSGKAKAHLRSALRDDKGLDLLKGIETEPDVKAKMDTAFAQLDAAFAGTPDEKKLVDAEKAKLPDVIDNKVIEQARKDLKEQTSRAAGRTAYAAIKEKRQNMDIKEEKAFEAKGTYWGGVADTKKANPGLVFDYTSYERKKDIRWSDITGEGSKSLKERGFNPREEFKLLWPTDSKEAKELRDLEAKIDAEKKAMGAMIVHGDVPKLMSDAEKQAYDLRQKIMKDSDPSEWGIPNSEFRVRVEKGQVSVILAPGEYIGADERAKARSKYGLQIAGNLHEHVSVDKPDQYKRAMKESANFTSEMYGTRQFELSFEPDDRPLSPRELARRAKEIELTLEAAEEVFAASGGARGFGISLDVRGHDALKALGPKKEKEILDRLEANSNNIANLSAGEEKTAATDILAKATAKADRNQVELKAIQDLRELKVDDVLRDAKADRAAKIARGETVPAIPAGKTEDTFTIEQQIKAMEDRDLVKVREAQALVARQFEQLEHIKTILTDPADQARVEQELKKLEDLTTKAEELKTAFDKRCDDLKVAMTNVGAADPTQNGHVAGIHTRVDDLKNNFATTVAEMTAVRPQIQAARAAIPVPPPVPPVPGIGGGPI